MNEQIHLGALPADEVLESLAEFICGDEKSKYPIYRSSMYLTKFFDSVGIKATHDGSTRKWWTLEILRQLPPSNLEAVILKLVDFKTYKANREQHSLAVSSMNEILLMENFEIGFKGSAPHIQRGKGISFETIDFTSKETRTEESFLKRQFSEDMHIDTLGLDSVISRLLQCRVDEMRSCPKLQAPLAIIFLIGSSLEGLLLAVALSSPQQFNTSQSAPKDKTGKVKKLPDWTLSDLINVSYSVGLLDRDVKEFSHVLRSYRNYIHPYEQLSQGFEPDDHTTDICWQVFRAAFHQLKRNLKTV